MPLPTIADTFRTAVSGVGSNGLAWAHVLHFRKTGALSYADAAAIVQTRLQAFWNETHVAGSPFKSRLHTGWRIDQFAHTPLDGTSATIVQTQSIAGSNTSEALPPQVALVASLKTNQRGRRNRGRFYLNGFVEGDNGAAGTPGAVLLSVVQESCNRLLANLVGSGTSLVVASYGGYDPVTKTYQWTPYATDVTQIVVDSRFDTQRRRLR